MSRRMLFPIATALITSALQLQAPPPVQAQALSLHSLERVKDAEGDRLEARAAALHPRMERWVEAAQLYERAAALREAGDARMVRALLYASRLYHHAGQWERALNVLERIAAASLAAGDVLQSAEALADAAWILAEQGHKGEAAARVSRAELLTRSPLLRVSERERLRRRLGVDDVASSRS